MIEDPSLPVLSSATRSSMLMLVASVAFAAMAVTIKLASQNDVPIAQIVFYQGLISLVLLYTRLHKLRVPLATPHLTAHLRRGVIGFAGMITYMVALVLLPVSTAITLNYTSPVILASMLQLIYRERLRPIMIVSILGGLGGVVLLLSPTYQSSQKLGAALALVSALLAAVTALNIRALGRLQEPPVRTALYFSLCVAVCALPWFILSRPASLSGKGALFVIVSGIAATIGQVLLTYAYQRGHTMLVSLLGYSRVVFTALLGLAIWGYRPTLAAWLGMILVVASGAMATFSVRDAPALPHAETCSRSPARIL